jgi:uncharacterized protein (TIGR00369 family)
VQLTAESYASENLLEGFPFPPCKAFLDSRFEHHDPGGGVLRLSFPTRAEYANPGGTVQGGILTAMIDAAMGPLVVAATGGTRVPVSTDLHTTFFKGATIGPRCFVEARIDRLGGSVAFTSAVVTDESGTILARAVHTARLINTESRG